MGDSVAGSVTNCTEGLAGVEVCGPVQGKLMLLILKLSENRNIQIHTVHRLVLCIHDEYKQSLFLPAVVVGSTCT